MPKKNNTAKAQRRRQAEKQAQERGATAGDKLPPQPNHIQVCGSSGETRPAQLPTGDAMVLREKELRDFTALCKGKDPTTCQEFIGLNLAQETPQSLAHFRAFIRHLCKGTMKVNGDTNNWSNGMFGSRWCDFRYDNKVIRYAYYSPTSDANNRTGKHHILQMTNYWD